MIVFLSNFVFSFTHSEVMLWSILIHPLPLCINFLYAFELKRIDGCKFLLHYYVRMWKSINFRLEIYLHLSCIKQIASRLSKTISYDTTRKKQEFELRLVKKSFVVGSCLLPLICLYIWCIFKHANSRVKLRHCSFGWRFYETNKVQKMSLGTRNNDDTVWTSYFVFINCVC